MFGCGFCEQKLKTIRVSWLYYTVGRTLNYSTATWDFGVLIRGDDVDFVTVCLFRYGDRRTSTAVENNFGKYCGWYDRGRVGSVFWAACNPVPTATLLGKL